MKFVPLKNSGRIAIVDDEHFDAVMQFEWSLAEPCKGHFYARKTKGGQIFMHRFIAELMGWQAEAIDHINHNGTDNRTENLRPCTAMENTWNSRRKRGVSGCPGVIKAGDGWVVKFRHRRQLHYFGYYLDLDEAKKVAEAALLHLRGEFVPRELAEERAKNDGRRRA